jgi:hypothetical protein
MPADRVSSWQRRMAPLMVGAVVATALFFAVISVREFGKIETWLVSQSSPAPTTAASGIQPATFDQQLQLSSAREGFALEREAMARRYNQGNLLIATRLWTRMMGFVTGMILALIGAAFVLGKLSEDTSELMATSSNVSVSLKSASPGIILCVLGTILMAMTIWVPVDLSTHDAALYVGQNAGLTDTSLGNTQAISPASPGTDDDSPYRNNQQK